jgi:hypothetical protein
MLVENSAAATSPILDVKVIFSAARLSSSLIKSANC